MLSIFSCVFAHLYVFLEKCLFKSSATFWLGCFLFFFVCFLFDTELFEWFVYFGNKYLVKVTSFENTLSHSVYCLFVLFMVSFAVQKLLNLIRSHLFIFVLVSITLEDRSKKLLLWFMSKCVLYMFSSRSFRLSGFIFRPLNHFEFIFVYGIRECSNFILLHGAVQFSWCQLLTRLSFLHCMFLPPLS